MALVVAEPVAEVASSTNATSYSLASFTPSYGMLLVLWVIATDTTAAGSVSNTGPSLTWVNRLTQTFASSAHSLYCFTAAIPALEDLPPDQGGDMSSAVITFDCTGDEASGAILMLQSVTGHNRFSPVCQTASNSGTGTTASITRSAALTNNAYLYAVGCNASFGGVPSAPSSYTTTSSTSYSVPTSSAGAFYRVNGETSTTVSSSVPGIATPWGAGYLEIYPEGSGPYKPVYQSIIAG